MPEVLLKLTYLGKVKKVAIANPSFEDLRNKIYDTYTRFDPASLNISYTDADGDVIQIESNEG
jgi:hypothetical protein